MTVQTSPLREQILQKRKKRNRKILLFLLIGAAVLAAVITAVVLLANQPRPEQQPTGPWLKEIRPTQAGGVYSYQVTGESPRTKLSVLYPATPLPRRQNTPRC